MKKTRTINIEIRIIMLLVGFRIFGILLAFLFGNKNHPSAVGPWVMSTILFYNLLVEMPETKFKIT